MGAAWQFSGKDPKKEVPKGISPGLLKLFANGCVCTNQDHCNAADDDDDDDDSSDDDDEKKLANL